ncbi:hypothetical protein PYV02_05565 [Leifsonia sp. H3M29-4]|uniref:hypothetical protein n=1 Tax=Salinibacterium metalliresistens TaxID=3031321 RepID=UPI0023DAB62E|nr:hypothetical protein [Salinibacterium metalliresistens]MDF1478550.1 hypothetical protein [Salinibacterium metalliresistens]
MRKATLTSGQVVAAIFAGIIGHAFFAAGWFGLGVVLLGGVVTAILGGTIGGLGGAFGNETIDAVLGGAGGVVGGLVIGLGIGAVVVMLLGVLFSWLILRAGKVRKPAAVTWMSVLITALLSLPLLLVYGAIAGNAADGQPRFTIVAAIGTAVIGALVWLWMTWAFRGPASEFAGQSATSAGSVAAAPPAPVVEAPPVAPAVEAPPVAPAPAAAEVVEPAAPAPKAPAPKSATAKAPVAKSATAKAPVAKKPPAAKKPTE